MAVFASLAILATSFLSVMAAPTHKVSTAVAAMNTPYHGYGTYYTDKRNACGSEFKYSFDEPIVAVNTHLFDKSLCGKYVSVSLKDSSDKHTFKIVDHCPECDENSLDFSKVAIDQFSDSGFTAIDWQIVDGPSKGPSKPVAKPISKPAAKPTSSSSNDKHSGTTYRGRGTWFSDNSGSCGERFSQDDLIVAVNMRQMKKMWGKGSQCGRKIRVSAKGYSGSVVVRVVDTCPDRYCDFGDLDLSRAAFKRFAPMSVGVLDLEWSWV